MATKVAFTASLSPPLDTPNATSISPTTNKVKYLFSPDDWLFIGSALALSTSMMIMFLALVGRVSFAKPFSGCLVSSAVLRALWWVTKDQTFDLTPLVDTMISFMPKSYLGEGSSFNIEDQNYYIAPTEGDGACGAHAVLGTKTNGYIKYMYREGNVREYYVASLLEKKLDKAFQSSWEDWMIHFVQDYLSPDSGFYSKLVFSESLVKDLRDKLSLLELKKPQLQTDQEKLFTQALEQGSCRKIIMDMLQTVVLEEQERTSKKGLLNQLNIDDGYRFCKIQENLDDIIELLEGHDVGKLISENLKAQEKVDNERTECYRAFIRKDEVLEAYITGVSNSRYYFATQELGLMAQIFNLHVRVFHENDGVVTMELDEGKGSDVVVFHGGAHFSRCEPRLSEQLVK